MDGWRSIGKWAVVAALAGLMAGCSSFRYTPTYEHSFPSDAKHTGLAIRTGQDLRPDSEKRPAWAKNAEIIVARALADEVRHAKMFDHVKLHADAANPAKYPVAVEFRVLKFECASHPSFLESTGRTLLQYQGIRGALIEKSIPTKYTTEIEVEFQILTDAQPQPVFDQTYQATRTVTLNGYQSSQPMMEQTSAALEEVLAQFLPHLAAVNVGAP